MATIQSQISLACQPPPCGFFKLNIDGSRVSDCGCIVVRVIIRNSYGIWIEGFSANLGHGEVFMVEAWAISKGIGKRNRQKCTMWTDVACCLPICLMKKVDHYKGLGNAHVQIITILFILIFHLYSYIL